MAIQTYKIRCEVTLQSYQEGKAVKLTPFIRTLTVKKFLNQPAGNFEIQLLPGTDPKHVSWYYRTSPMDYVEIRFTRDSTLKEIPVVMRGFVDDIGITASVDADGRPIRIYTITGSDMGKLFDITRIYYLREVSEDLQLIYLPGFKQFEAKYHCQVTGKPAEIIETLFKVAQNQLALIKQTQPSVPDIKYLASSTVKGAVNQFALSQEDGSVWQMMTFFDNSPWNELFTVDLDDAFYLVFRETPWKDPDSGKYIQGVDPQVDKMTLGASVQVPSNSILRFDLRRGDAETKNYFFTYPVQNLINGEVSFKALNLAHVEKEEDLKTNPYLIDHKDRDAGAYRFGFRRFENNCEVFDTKDLIASQKLAEELNLTLFKAFRYNSAYESGSFTLKGDSALRPGVYMIFNYQGGFTPEYYVTGVSHDLSFVAGSEQFSTTVTVERGTGYLHTRNMLYTADAVMERTYK